MNRRHLALVAPEEELHGKGPLLFERLARSAEVGSLDHIGLVAICLPLSIRALSSNLPPSARADLHVGIDAAQRWLKQTASLEEVQQARVSCFQYVSVAEELTVKAVVSARDHQSSMGGSPLDHHANHVVERYCRLAAHFTVSSICHLLDAISTPQASLEVLQDVQGARAYQATGLGAARHSAFRAAAWDQAKWESAKVGAAAHTETEVTSIALQVFHEYLGGRWRKQADAESAQIHAFITWALEGRRPVVG